MADVYSAEKRSWIMSRIRSRDTRPERVVRSLLHRLGLRFTVNGPSNRSLPGRPDIVLPKFATVIFVHGCFWHRHRSAACRLATSPKTRKAFWREKFARNVRRDGRVKRQLRQLGWRTLTVWECSTKTQTALARLESRLAREFGTSTRDAPKVIRYDFSTDSSSQTERVAEPTSDSYESKN